MTAEPDAAAAAVMLSLLCRARERARQRVEADLGEGDDPSTQQIAMTAELDAAAVAGGAVAGAVEQEDERGGA